MNMLMQWPRSGRSLAGDDFDTLFEGFFRPMRRFEGPESYSPPMDITERENEYLIHAEMPGVDKDAIDITLADGVLTITGESKQEREEKEGERVVRQERRYGRYTRSVQLGSQVDEKQVKATYKDGVLELVLPKAEEVKPKKITIS